jgi:hypothetical protein
MPLVTGTCANCSRERPLKYARRTMCATYACQRAAAAEVAARKAGSRGDSERESKAPPVFCYEILSVNGQRDFDPANLVGKAKRNEVGEDEFVVSYLVFGRFAEDEDDEGFKDTRWVDLEDLLQNEPNLDGTQLKPLEAYEKKLAKRMAGEKKRLREAMEEDGE